MGIRDNYWRHTHDNTQLGVTVFVNFTNFRFRKSEYLENDCCASLRAELASAGVYPPAGESPTGLWTGGSALVALATVLSGTKPLVPILSVLATAIAEFTPPSSPKAPIQWADLEGGETFSALSYGFSTALSDPETQQYIQGSIILNPWASRVDSLLRSLSDADYDYQNISLEDVTELGTWLENSDIFDLPEGLTSVIEEIERQSPALLTLYKVVSQNPQLEDLTMRALPILEGYQEQLALLTLASVPEELDAISPLLEELTPEQFASLAQNRNLIMGLAEGSIAQENLSTAINQLAPMFEDSSVAYDTLEAARDEALRAFDRKEEAGPLIELYEYAIVSPQFVGELADSLILYPFVAELLASEGVQAVIAEQLFTVQGLDAESTVFDKALEEAVNRALGIETLDMGGAEGESGTLSDAIASVVDTRMSDYGFTPPAEETGSEDLGFLDSEGRQIDPFTGEVIGESTSELDVVLPQDVQAEIQYLIDSALVNIRADVNKAGATAGVALATATGVMGTAAAALGTALAALATANAAMTAAANTKCDCTNGGTTHTASASSDQRNPPWLGSGRPV